MFPSKTCKTFFIEIHPVEIHRYHLFFFYFLSREDSVSSAPGPDQIGRDDIGCRKSERARNKDNFSFDKNQRVEKNRNKDLLDSLTSKGKKTERIT